MKIATKLARWTGALVGAAVMACASAADASNVVFQEFELMDGGYFSGFGFEGPALGSGSYYYTVEFSVAPYYFTPLAEVYYWNTELTDTTPQYLNGGFDGIFGANWPIHTLGNGIYGAFEVQTTYDVWYYPDGLIEMYQFTTPIFNWDLEFPDAPSNLVTLTISSAPEPAAWAMMIAGLGLAGAALRRRRTLAAA